MAPCWPLPHLVIGVLLLLLLAAAMRAEAYVVPTGA